MVNKCCDCHNIFIGLDICSKCRKINNKEDKYSKNKFLESYYYTYELIIKSCRITTNGYIINPQYRVKFIIYILNNYINLIKLREQIYGLTNDYRTLLNSFFNKLIEFNNSSHNTEYSNELKQIIKDVGFLKNFQYIIFYRLKDNTINYNYDNVEYLKMKKEENYNNLEIIINELKYPFIFYNNELIGDILIHFPKIYKVILNKFDIDKNYIIKTLIYKFEKYGISLNNFNELFFSILDFELKNELNENKIIFMDLIINTEINIKFILNFLNYLSLLEPFITYDLFIHLNNINDNIYENYIFKNKNDENIIMNMKDLLNLILVNKIGENDLKSSLNYSILIKNVDLLLKYMFNFNYDYKIKDKFDNIEDLIFDLLLCVRNR